MQIPGRFFAEFVKFSLKWAASCVVLHFRAASNSWKLHLSLAATKQLLEEDSIMLHLKGYSLEKSIFYIFSIGLSVLIILLKFFFGNSKY